MVIGCTPSTSMGEMVGSTPGAGGALSLITTIGKSVVFENVGGSGSSTGIDPSNCTGAFEQTIVSGPKSSTVN